MPAWPRAVGILTHWAIARNLRPSPEACSSLRNQEVALLWELREKGEIPPLESRHEDNAEFPLLLQEGETTWVGVADRVYGRPWKGPGG